MSHGDNPNEIDDMQEAAELEYQRLRELSRRLDSPLLPGIERLITDRGDILFTSDMRPTDEVTSEQGAFSVQSLMLRMTRAGQPTGGANAKIEIERDEHGIISNRTRLQCLEVGRSYRGEGLGDCLLQEVELHARRYGSTEIYGLYSAEGDPTKVRVFYERHGYHFRRRESGGEEVYKPLRDDAQEIEHKDT